MWNPMPSLSPNLMMDGDGDATGQRITELELSGAVGEAMIQMIGSSSQQRLANHC